MSVTLDTHAWLWWVDGADALSASARRTIEEADQIHLSAISCWEVATLVRLGRIRLDRDVGLWVRQALRDDRIQVLPVSAEIAVEAGSLDGRFPGDPADRIIYATARSTRAPLITRDRALRAFDRERTIW